MADSDETPVGRRERASAPSAAQNALKADKPAGGASEERSVDEWALLYFPPRGNGAPHPDLWKHHSAAALHGWAAYAYDQNGAMKLGAAAYEGALKAATTVDDNGISKPHPAAVYEGVK